MPRRQLEATDAFVVTDVAGADRAVGQVRMARKILEDGAWLLARSWTYLFASFEQRVSGASAGINAAGDAAGPAVDAFVQELTADATSGGLCLEAAKGVTDQQLGAFRADGRADLFWEHRDGLRGLSAALAADAAVGLDGRAVLIEGFDAAAVDLVRAVYDRGGRVVGVGTARGAAAHPRGLDAATLAQAWRQHGPGLVEHLEVVNQPADRLWSIEADVLFAGSRAGVVDHDLAAGLELAALVPLGPVPYTTRALAVLGRSGTVVVPDFLALAGPMFAMWPGDGADLEGVRAAVTVAVLGALGEVLDADEGPVLAACRRAEAYLSTWVDDLPFGRPMA